MGISNVSSGLRSGVCTSTTRPTAPYEGQMIYETDTDMVVVWNGSAWRYIASTSATNGTVLQVVTGNTTTTVTNSTSTMIDTNLTATITPKSTSSKVLVMTSQVVGKGDQYGENRVSVSLVRNSTSLMNTGTLVNYDTKVQYDIGECTILYLDSPATTSATVYKTQISNPNNTAYAVAQYGSGTSTIILMEIAA